MNKLCLTLTAAVSLVVLMLSGAAHAADKNMYYWSTYERDLFVLSEESSPAAMAQFEATLRRIIDKSEATGRKVQPGLLAEYGYTFYERGEFDSAIQYFERERQQWPESSTLMNRMIQQAQKESRL